MEVATDTSNMGMAKVWLDCQVRIPFQPFKSIPLVLWTKEEINFFELLVDDALQKCLSMVSLQNLSPKSAQARKLFLEQGEIIGNSFYILGKQKLVRMQFFKADLEAQSAEW